MLDGRSRCAVRLLSLPKALIARDSFEALLGLLTTSYLVSGRLYPNINKTYGWQYEDV
jgi:hypothetical protein